MHMHESFIWSVLFVLISLEDLEDVERSSEGSDCFLDVLYAVFRYFSLFPASPFSLMNVSPRVACIFPYGENFMAKITIEF